MADAEHTLVEVGRLGVETLVAWGIDQAYMAVEDAALLFFVLRERVDTPEAFPKGKWASIQFFEGLITDVVRRGAKGGDNESRTRTERARPARRAG